MDDHIRLCTLDWDAYTRCARQAAAEGIVLLRNKKSVLPLAEGARVSLFGRGQLTYYKSGTGSGGMVNVSKVTGIREALEDEPGIILNETLEHLYDRW
ncbi:MAG: beta-glucosidase, partial [Lachnospiraceae bacterium]|nr:beta-glucosidase [Lachnospiraceae bacterium]